MCTYKNLQFYLFKILISAFEKTTHPMARWDWIANTLFLLLIFSFTRRLHKITLGVMSVESVLHFLFYFPPSLKIIYISSEGATGQMLGLLVGLLRTRRTIYFIVFLLLKSLWGSKTYQNRCDKVFHLLNIYVMFFLCPLYLVLFH